MGLELINLNFSLKKGDISGDFLKTMMTLIGEGDLYAGQYSSTLTPTPPPPPTTTAPITETPTNAPAPVTPPKDHVIEKVPEQTIPETPTLVDFSAFNAIRFVV